MGVIIIGGGVIGICCAYYLQKRGYDITIIDRGDMLNGCSFGNAGYVSPSHFTPLASPGIIAQGIRWMLRSNSPFYIKPRMSIDLARWGVTFWRNAKKEVVERNSPHLSELLHFSRRLTSEIRNELGNHFRMQEKGCLMLYKNPSTEKYEIELAEKAAAYGIETRILSADEVQELETNTTVNVRGGVLYPIDAHLHPGEFMQTLVSHLDKKGVKFLKNTNVRSFEIAGGDIKIVVTDKGKINADEVVVAAGSWLPVVARLLGVRILLQAGKGYSMTFNDVDHNLQYPAILVDDRVAMTPLGKDLRMGGTMEISGVNDKILVNRARSIFDASKKYYPDLSLEFPGEEKIWTGLRPLSPDGLPYIGRHKRYSNLIVAGGHAMLGLSLAAGTGKVVEEIVSESRTSVDVRAYNVQRFG